MHKDSIGVAVVEADGAERQSGLIPNRPEALRRLVRRLRGPVAFAFEAGLTAPFVRPASTRAAAGESL